MRNQSNGRGWGAYTEMKRIMYFFRKRKTVSAVNVETTTTTTVNTGIASPENENLSSAKGSRESEAKGKIYNLIILDESGSMGSIYNQALSGANETLNTIRLSQKEDESLKQFLTFVAFDSGSNRPDVREIISLKPITEVKDLTKDDYRPSGCTPLYDAMGISLKKLSEVVGKDDNVLVTIITDGYENSSHQYSASMVKEMVDSLRAKGWVFTYIGANQDSVEVAGGLGIHNAMDFEQDGTGAKMMWDKMNSGRREFYKKASRMRMTGAYEDLESDFFDMDRDDSRVTPDIVTELADNEILVLGSSGRDGLEGNKYYINTFGRDLDDIRKSVQRFIYIADYHQEKRYLVTRVGCGHAGYDDEQIAPLFALAYCLPNISLPESFWNVLDYNKFNR